MFYFDFEMNEIMDVWKNFWLGQEVFVVYVVNDLVNMWVYFYEKDDFGKFMVRVVMCKYGDVMVFLVEILLFYFNLFGSEF